MFSSWEQESSPWTVLWHVGWADVLFGLVLLLGRRQEKPSKLPLGRKDCQTSSSQISITRLLGDDRGWVGLPATATTVNGSGQQLLLLRMQQCVKTSTITGRLPNSGYMEENRVSTRILLDFLFSYQKQTNTQFTQCVYDRGYQGQVTILGVCLTVSSALSSPSVRLNLSLFHSLLLLLTTTIAQFARILGAGLSRDTEEIKKYHWEPTALFHRS